MKVLIACECSGRVRQAFRSLGYDAWSCDIKPAEDDSPYHIQTDVLEILGGFEKPSPFGWVQYPWDMMIAHPVCKYLANSGSKHLYIDMKKENGIYQPRWDEMEKGAEFYSRLWNSNIPFIAAENPIWHRHAKEAILRRCPDHPGKRQFVQPWMFGHLEVKATGLALRNLPQLVETDNVKAETMALEYGERAKVHYASPGPEREADRSRTLQGLADAMALQWGRYVEEQMRMAA